MVIPTDTIILDIFYITDPKYRVLLTSTNDGVIRGWKFQGTSYVLAPQPENEEDFIFHQFVNEIYCMAWDSLNEVLYCSDKEGSITTWNLKTDIEKPLSDGAANDGHTLIVMSMVTMPKLQFMASGGMDGKLILWDTINNRKKWIYKEHARGIMTLAFN
jgi:WD40 repeat protein